MKYRSTCRFSMLAYIDDRIVQLRPGEIIESRTEINYPFLVPIKKKKKPVSKVNKEK